MRVCFLDSCLIFWGQHLTIRHLNVKHPKTIMRVCLLNSWLTFAILFLFEMFQSESCRVMYHLKAFNHKCGKLLVPIWSVGPFFNPCAMNYTIFEILCSVLFNQANVRIILCSDLREITKKGPNKMLGNVDYGGSWIHEGHEAVKLGLCCWYTWMNPNGHEA